MREGEINKFNMMYEISNPLFDVFRVNYRSCVYRKFPKNLHKSIKKDKQFFMTSFSFCWILYNPFPFTLLFPNSLSKFYITFDQLKDFILHYFLTSNDPGMVRWKFEELFWALLRNFQDIAINQYITKSWSVAFNVATLPLSHVSSHLIITFFI